MAVNPLPPEALVVRGGGKTFENWRANAWTTVPEGYFGVSVLAGELELAELVHAGIDLLPQPIICRTTVARLAGWEMVKSGSHPQHYTVKIGNEFKDSRLIDLMGCFDDPESKPIVE